MIDEYRRRMNLIGQSDGEMRRKNAQQIMKASFSRDPACKKVYVKWVDSGLPCVDEGDVPVDAKYNVKSYHNITGDAIAYLLQFRLEDMQYNSEIRVGSYVYIPNEANEYEWWLLVHLDDRPLFRQFSILKCTWIYKWVSKINGKRIIYQCLGAPRKQNSYNSGVWLDYTTQTVENQEVMWLPTNSETKTILYDTKFLKSAPGRYPALKWTITKIEDTANEGISRFTMAQTQFDPNKDNVEEMIADYYESAVAPVEPTDKPVNYIIEYSGSPAVKAGGSFKKFMLKQEQDGQHVDVTDPIEWSVDFSEFNDKLTLEYDGNVCRIKCIDDYSLIGKIFSLTATCNNTSSCIDVEVASL